MRLFKTILALIWMVMGIISFQRGDITNGLLSAILMCLTPYMKKI